MMKLLSLNKLIFTWMNMYCILLNEMYSFNAI